MTVEFAHLGVGNSLDKAFLKCGYRCIVIDRP